MDAAFTAAAILAALLLALRLFASDTAAPMQIAYVVARYGGLVAGLLTVAVISVTAAGPLLRMVSGMAGSALGPMLRLYDAALHLALVLSVAAAIAALSLLQTPSFPFLWFSGQAVMLWASHRMRLGLFGGGAAKNRG